MYLPDSIAALARWLGTLAVLATLAAAPALAEPVMPARFTLLRAQDLRVATVAYRLSIANRGLCESALAPQAGLILHGIEQYGLGDRAGAARSYGLGRDVGIMAVVAGSPAARAGVIGCTSSGSTSGRRASRRS